MSDPNYCTPRVAMFGLQRGEGAVQYARSGPELMCHAQGGPLTHPHCGTSFLSLWRLSVFTYKIGPKRNTKVDHLFCSILLPLSPTYAQN